MAFLLGDIDTLASASKMSRDDVLGDGLPDVSISDSHDSGRGDHVCHTHFQGCIQADEAYVSKTARDTPMMATLEFSPGDMIQW